jgi:hypothetical protein
VRAAGLCSCQVGERGNLGGSPPIASDLANLAIRYGGDCGTAWICVKARGAPQARSGTTEDRVAAPWPARRSAGGQEDLLSIQDAHYKHAGGVHLWHDRLSACRDPDSSCVTRARGQRLAPRHGVLAHSFRKRAASVVADGAGGAIVLHDPRFRDSYVMSRLCASLSVVSRFVSLVSAGRRRQPTGPLPPSEQAFRSMPFAHSATVEVLRAQGARQLVQPPVCGYAASICTVAALRYFCHRVWPGSTMCHWS